MTTVEKLEGFEEEFSRLINPFNIALDGTVLTESGNRMSLSVVTSHDGRQHKTTSYSNAFDVGDAFEIGREHLIAYGRR